MVGGGQRGLLYILERLNREQFEPIVIVPSYGLLLNKVKELNISTRCFKIKGIKNPLNLITTVVRIVKIIWSERIDLLHTDSPKNTIYGGLSAKITGKPLIYHARVGDRDKLDKLLYFLSTKIIAVSKATAKRFNSSKVEIIYNAIDVKRFNPDTDNNEIRKEFNMPSRQTGKNDILIGTIGQLIPKKGQKEFLNAASGILKIYPKIKFIIVGNGNKKYKEELEELCRSLNISQSIIFTGFRDDVPAIMSALDIFVLATSYPEGLCRTILEAMACGKPVITTNVGSNPEALINGVTGILLPPPGSPSLLKDAILKLIKDEQKRKEMGEKGRERAVELFNIETHIREIEKLYLDLLTPLKRDKNP